MRWKRPCHGLRGFSTFSLFTLLGTNQLGAMEVERFSCFHTACLIQLQIRSQGIGGHSTQLGALVVWHTLALEPQGFHPLLHARMRMMVAFVVQRLFVCLTECKLEHPGGILVVRRSMVTPHHR